MASGSGSSRAEFVKLREAYELLADIYEAGGVAQKATKGVSVTRVPKETWVVFKARLRGCEELVSQLIEGHGEKRSFAGEKEVVLAGMELDGDLHATALLLVGRSRIVDSISLNLSEPGWQDRLRDFADWEEIGSVVAAADGNNQRAIVGLVLTLAGIGRGQLGIVEVEMPQEIDEATHLVRGAEWMKAGLPRFKSAAAEALWYAMRLRSVHSRLVRTKKQGLYTAMALTALYASGCSTAEISKRASIRESLVVELISYGRGSRVDERDAEFLNDYVFVGDKALLMEDRVSAAVRIWRGPSVYKRGMDWRISVSRRAREALFEGKDLVEVAESFKIQRRELVRILSVSLGEAVFERDRFLSGIVKPSTLLKVAK